MTDPFSWLEPRYRGALLALLVVGSVSFAIAPGTQGRLLRTGAAPGGIVSLQFAWSSDGAARILESWAKLVEVARRQLFIDFGFLILYPLGFSLGCAMLARSRENSMAEAGLFLSWAMLAATPLDATENLALLRMLDRGPSDPLARLAGCCAGLKFLLVFAGMGYLGFQGLAVLVRKLTQA